MGLAKRQVEPGEDDKTAMLRELAEETGYRANPSELEHLGTYGFIAGKNEPMQYVTYRVKLKDTHKVQLEADAHAKYQWVTAQECYAKSDLIPDFHKLLRLIGYID